MRLWNKNDSPVGGWKYFFEDDKGNKFASSAPTAKTLQIQVIADMKANGITPPNNIWCYIEDQICSRQPSGRCFYEDKAGDQIAKLIHKFAGGIDKAAASIGIISTLEKRARTCTTCHKRRVYLNT